VHLGNRSAGARRTREHENFLHLQHHLAQAIRTLSTKRLKIWIRTSLVHNFRTKHADKWGVARSTLSRRHRGVTVSRAAQAEQSKNLTTTQQQQQQELLLYIKKFTEQGLPPTRQMVQNFGSAGE
jgi:hypothetical protein